MVIKIIDNDFSICKVNDVSEIDFSDEFCFVGKTDEELSLVCTEGRVPKSAETVTSGFKAFRIEGVLDFSLIGILSKISTLLAEAKIGIFAISTYNTDYILLRKENLKAALSVLSANGYDISM